MNSNNEQTPYVPLNLEMQNMGAQAMGYPPTQMQPNQVIGFPQIVSNQPYGQGQLQPQIQNFAMANQQNFQMGQMVQPSFQPVQMMVQQPYFVSMRGENAFQKLSVPGIFIKQKPEVLEALTGCEMQNKYKIKTTDEQGLEGYKSIFKAKEKSSFCSRNCLRYYSSYMCVSGDCRPFQILIYHKSAQKHQENEGDLFLKLERNCAFTCLCLDRPFVVVTLLEGGVNKFIGRIVHKFSCFEAELQINDEKDNLKYLMKGSLCQIGMNRAPFLMCQSCQEAFFFVYSKDGDRVGIIEKKGKGFMSVMTDADNFVIIFPVFATLQDRALLMACALMLDFRYFETGAASNNRNQRIRIEM